MVYVWFITRCSWSLNNALYQAQNPPQHFLFHASLYLPKQDTEPRARTRVSRPAAAAQCCLGLSCSGKAPTPHDSALLTRGPVHVLLVPSESCLLRSTGYYPCCYCRLCPAASAPSSAAAAAAAGRDESASASNSLAAQRSVASSGAGSKTSSSNLGGDLVTRSSP